MAVSQPARSPVRADPHQDWLSQAVADIRSTGQRLAWPSSEFAVVGPPPRQAAPFGGHLISGPDPSPDGSRISAAFGGVPAMTPAEEATLRRQQADFGEVARKVDKQNSWAAIPALAPEMVVDLLGLTGMAGGAALARQVARVPFDFPKLESWQVANGLKPLARGAKDALRDEARDIYARAYGVKARLMGAHVHHTPQLEYAHLFPNANPNRLSALQALVPPAHQIATAAWAAFGRSLAGRIPTQAEVMAEKLRIDRLVEPYLLRRGVPRSPLPKNKGLQ